MQHNQMEIQCNRLDRGYHQHQAEYERKALEVLRSGNYILGNELKSFEEKFAEYVGTKYCVGVACGLDSIRIATHLLGVGVGDEVIVSANTYIATILGFTLNGATPVLIEPDQYYNIDTAQIEKRITNKTKAIMAVHLYGQPADMLEIRKIAQKYDLLLLEDCAQAHGAKMNKETVGTFGEVGCFSFYPTKNLGAFGDAGAIVTNSPELYERARCYRNYGSAKQYYFREPGINSRLDELQAGLLSVRLKYLDECNKERMMFAQRYTKYINNGRFLLPEIRKGAEPVWHQYVIRVLGGQRERLQAYLAKRRIHVAIHYPIPPHLSDAYKEISPSKCLLPFTEQLSREVLSLPLYAGMTEEEQFYVIEKLNQFE